MATAKAGSDNTDRNILREYSSSRIIPAVDYSSTSRVNIQSIGIKARS